MSEQPSTPRHSESTLGRSIELLHALNAAAATLQQSAHSEQEIFRAFSEQVRALGLRGGLSLLDESRQNLTVLAVAQPPVITKLLARVEGITRIKTVGYSIPLAKVPAYQQVVETSKALFIDDSSVITTQLLPPIAKPFTKHIVRVFGNSSIIYAPLLHETRVIGIINIAGKNLIPSDVPTMEAFANHIAIALTNARLVSALRQTAEERLKFSLGIERSSEAIFVTQTDGTITYVNPAFEKLYGYPKAKAIGKTPRILKSGVMSPEDYKFFWETLLARQVVTGELINKTSDGRLLTIEGSTGPIIDETDKLIGFLAIQRDISERKHHEREIEAIASVSAALRTAATRDEMFPVIVNQISAVLNTVGAAIGLRDSVTGESVIKHANGNWTDAVGERVPPGRGVSGRVFATKQPFVTNDLSKDPIFFTRRLIGNIKGAMCVPLVTYDDVIGWVFAGVTTTFADEDVRILKAIADIAANALRRASLHEETQRAAANLALAYDTTLEGWARALDLRDKATQDHTRRVVEMTLTLAQGIGIASEELIHVRRGALLHDIGKIAVSDSILLKPGPLTEEEWKIMRMHPVYAYEMLSPIEYLRPALDIPYCHHEKWDGTGYPRGISGEEIPLVARIFAVADVWDALCSNRPYSRAWESARAIEHIRAQAGKHFDPQVVAAFLQIVA